MIIGNFLKEDKVIELFKPYFDKKILKFYCSMIRCPNPIHGSFDNTEKKETRDEYVFLFLDKNSGHV